MRRKNQEESEGFSTVASKVKADVSEGCQDCSIAEYFKVKSSRDIKWSHATNSSYALAKALSSKCHMIEGDILMGVCSSYPTTVAIMAHPPNTVSDLSFEDFILSIHNENNSINDTAEKKGVKLDFKDPEAVLCCLKFLKSISFDAPVFVNADIWDGNGGSGCTFVAKDFFSAVKSYAPNSVLSVGWKVGKTYKLLLKCGGYTWEQVERAIADIEEAYPSDGSIRRPLITFPLQTLMARQSSRGVIQRLLSVGSITFWGESTTKDIEWANSLDGIIFMDTLKPSWQAKYLIAYTLPISLSILGIVGLSFIINTN